MRRGPIQGNTPRPSHPTVEMGPWYDEIHDLWWVVSEDGPTSALDALKKFECEAIFPIYYGWKVTIEPVSIRWAEDSEDHEPGADCIEVSPYSDESTVQAWQIKVEGSGAT